LPGSISLGRWRGIAVRAHWSALVTVLVAAEILVVSLPVAAPGHTHAAYWLTAGLTGVAFVAAILVHELAHAVTARRFGMQVRSITLWMLGGATQLGGDAPTPRAETAVAVAGPLATLVTAGLAWAAAWLVPGGLAAAALGWLAVMSLILAVFNLLPAAPLDGGRVLRGILWARFGDRDRANRAAVTSGRTLGAMLIALGALEVLAGLVGGLWLALLGWFVRSSASAELRVATGRGLVGVPVDAAMAPVALIAPSWWTVEQLLDCVAATAAAPDVIPVVDVDGHAKHTVALANLRRAMAVGRRELRISELITGPVPVIVGPGTPLIDVEPMVSAGRRVLVVDELQRPVGVVTAAELGRAAQHAGTH
jgi:Zn-dependent protease